MEELFNHAIEDLSNRVGITEVERNLLEKVDQAANELVVSEQESHLLRKYNERIPEVLKNHELMGIPFFEKYGGNGARPLTWALAIERFGQVSLGVVTFIDVHQVLASLTIQQWGNDEQKERYLAQASTGKSILAFALTEFEAGSDPASLQTSYRRESNNYYVSGSKYLVSNGSIADNAIVFAYPEGKRSAMSAFIVDNESSGLRVDTKPIDKIGLFTSDTSTLLLDEVRVPKENLLGGEGMGRLSLTRPSSMGG